MPHSLFDSGAAVNISSLVTGTLFALAFALQWFKHRQYSYVVFFVSGIFYLIADSTNLAFALQAKISASAGQTQLSGHLKGMLFSVYTFSILGVLLTTQEVVRLLKIWSLSMESAALPGASRCRTAVNVSNWLYWIYLLLALGDIAATAVTLWASKDIAVLAALFVWLFCICVTIQIAVSLWLWLSVRKGVGELYAFKSTQMKVLLGLAFFTPVEHMFSAFILSRKPLRWFFYNMLAAWPGNLMAIDQKVDVAAVDFKSGVEEMAKHEQETA